MTPASDQSSASAPEPRDESRRAVVREVWAIAWPTVLTMASYTVMQFVDSLMVSRVGALEVAAQGNGGVWSFAVVAFLFGILTMVNTFVAQNVGAGRPDQAARFGWTALWFSLLAWLFILLPYAAMLPLVFGLMGHEERLVELETDYARILLVGGIVTLAGKGLSSFFFGIHRPGVVAMSAILGNVANVGLNFVLIYGEEGLPEFGLPGIPGTPALGVAGAAIATVCGTAVELVIPISIFLSNRYHREFATRSTWRPSLSALRDLVRVGWPNGLQFGNELICWAIFMSVLVGTFGSVHMVAGWSVLRYMHLSFMPTVGFATATTALVGRCIGEGRPDAAARRAHVAVAMAMVYMTVCAALMFAFRGPLVAIFADGQGDPELAAEVVAIGSTLMICAAVFQTFDALGIVYAGALRGAGDTLVPGAVTVGLSWAVIVGFGWWLTENAPGLASLGPWIASAAYIIVLGVFLAFRFEGGEWRKIRLLSGPVAPTAAGDA